MLLSVPLVAHLIAALTILFLGVIVYFHDRKSAANIVLFLHTLIIALWTISNYFSITVGPEESLFWIRLVIFFAVPHVFLFFLFSYVFPNRELKVRAIPSLIYVVSLGLAAFIALSPYGFRGINFENGLVTPVAGILMPLFALIILSFSFWTIIILIKKYQSASLVEKRQYISVFIGLGTSYLLLISLVFLAVNVFEITYFVPFSPFFILPMIVGAMYAILRHELLRVKVITTEILTYSILVILLFRVLLAKELIDALVGVIVLGLFLPFGIFLIRSVLREVEQRERLEVLTKELEATNSKLKQLDQLKTEFLSFASHQVKSPMNVVKGFAQLIYDGTYGEVSEQVKDTAHKIKDSADRLIILVNNLLDIGKIEEGKLEFKFADVDLVQLVHSMVDEYKVIGDARGLAVNFSSSVPTLRMQADEEKLRQVLQNLIDNSIKYTEKGSVDISVQDDGDTALVTVRDTGRGLAKDLQAKLFQRFVRDEKTKREIQGTGLGLYIAKQIVNAHHGEIWAESDGEGKGSRFNVRLSKTWVAVQ